MYFLEENMLTWIQISLQFVPEHRVDQPGGKPLPEPILTHSTDVYVSLGFIELNKAL